MKEIKILFNDPNDNGTSDSFAVYVNGVQQENVKEIHIHARNLGGDMQRGLVSSAHIDDIAEYTITHYFDVISLD